MTTRRSHTTTTQQGSCIRQLTISLLAAHYKDEESHYMSHSLAFSYWLSAWESEGAGGLRHAESKSLLSSTFTGELSLTRKPVSRLEILVLLIFNAKILLDNANSLQVDHLILMLLELFQPCVPVSLIQQMRVTLPALVCCFQNL